MRIYGTGIPPSAVLKIGAVDIIFKAYMMVRLAEGSGNQPWRTVPWLYNTSNIQDLTIWGGGFFINSKEGEIRFQLGSQLGNSDRYTITIEYTKP